MNPPIPHLPPHLGTKHQHLLPRPPQPPRKSSHAEPLEPASEILVRPQAQIFVLPVARPRVRRPLVRLLDDVDEARRGHHVLELGDVLVGAAELDGGLVEVVEAAVEGVSGLEGVVVGAGEEVAFLELEVAAWGEVAFAGGKVSKGMGVRA